MTLDCGNRVVFSTAELSLPGVCLAICLPTDLVAKGVIWLHLSLSLNTKQNLHQQNNFYRLHYNESFVML
jgi:hypothetical protein